jgi:hypothetical protein
MNIGLSETSPKIDASFNKRIKTIASHLNNEKFKNAYASFDFSNLKPHWFVYYFFCKKRFALGVYVMLRLMRTFVNK